MFGLEVLDVAVGMALLFLSVSLICSAIIEVIEMATKTRAKDLEKGLNALFNADRETIAAFFSHPLINGLFDGTYGPKQRNLPSYIPANQFAAALIDLVLPGAGAPPSSPSGAAPQSPAEIAAAKFVAMRNAAAAYAGNPQVKGMVLSAIDLSGGDLDKVRKNLEDTYNGTMDRVAGWYKRRTQRWLFVIGLLCAVLLNIDAIAVGRRLANDEMLRTAAVDLAAGVSDAGENPTGAAPPPAGTANPSDGATGPGASASADGALDSRFSNEKLRQLDGDLRRIGYPIGWQFNTLPLCALSTHDCREPFSWYQVPSMVLGWLITTLAVMLGGPFWFDVLNKFMIVRSTVKPKEKSPDEKPIG